MKVIMLVLLVSLVPVEANAFLFKELMVEMVYGRRLPRAMMKRILAKPKCRGEISQWSRRINDWLEENPKKRSGVRNSWFNHPDYNLDNGAREGLSKRRKRVIVEELSECMHAEFWHQILYEQRFRVPR